MITTLNNKFGNSIKRGLANSAVNDYETPVVSGSGCVLDSDDVGVISVLTASYWDLASNQIVIYG